MMVVFCHLWNYDEMRVLFIAFLYAFCTGNLLSQVSLRLKVGQNYGEILQQVGGRGAVLGNTDPFIQGQGSRITYPNQFPYWGMGILIQWNSWRWESELDSTVGYANTGVGKNEDFHWRENSRNSVPGFDLSQWRFRDSGYSFENTDRFLIHKSKTSVLDIRWQNRLERNFFTHENIDLYGILGFSISRNYFISYDVSFFDRTLKKIGYIYNGNSFENKIIEFQCGLGFRTKHFSERLIFDVSLAPLVGFNRSQDHHVVRNLIFEHSGQGNGFLARMESKWIMNENHSFAIRYTAHRFYAIGKWSLSGNPVSQEDIVKNIMSKGAGKNWVTNKESRWEAYFEFNFK